MRRNSLRFLIFVLEIPSSAYNLTRYHRYAWYIQKKILLGFQAVKLVLFVGGNTTVCCYVHGVLPFCYLKSFCYHFYHIVFFLFLYETFILLLIEISSDNSSNSIKVTFFPDNLANCLKVPLKPASMCCGTTTAII